MRAREHPALDRAERHAEPLGELGLRKTAVVGELERLALNIGELAQRGLHALALEPQPCRLFGLLGCLAERRVVGERLGMPALLPAHEIDCAAVDEREDPGARLRALCSVRRCGPPDLEECLLHGVLRVTLVSQNAKREPVCDATDTVVELAQRVLVATGDERDQCLVGEVGVMLAHGEAILRPGQR